jgi:cell division protein FtsN
MARARFQTATRKSSEGSFVLGIFVGLLVGIAVSVGVAFYLNRAPVPFAVSKPKDEKAAPVGKTPAIAGLPQGGGASQTAAAAPSGAADKPKFDFYKILPGTAEEAVSDKELRDRLKAQKSLPAGQQDASKDVYFIQAGAFQNPADADNQKARLAILGFESSVEPANLPDKGTWYRVRMGPYRKVDEINKVRQALAQNGIDANLVKIKEQ